MTYETDVASRLDDLYNPNQLLLQNKDLAASMMKPFIGFLSPAPNRIRSLQSEHWKIVVTNALCWTGELMAASPSHHLQLFCHAPAFTGNISSVVLQGVRQIGLLAACIK